MTDLQLRLKALVEKSLAACQGWLGEDGKGGLRLIDPVDRKSIVSHYGDSHLAAALLILARMRGEAALAEQGLKLTRTVIRDWNSSKNISDFHYDFNNFSLCLLDECLDRNAADLSQDIRALVLTTRDSNHDTINWLPMREYVNRCRYEWTGNERYSEAAGSAFEKVCLATNADGGIEDLLPIGSSYNLQYNTASLATLQLLSQRWPKIGRELGHTRAFLLRCVLPDGDVNFMGRGANQIFAWGPWLYVLACSGHDGALGQALTFLERRYSQAVGNSNILLNSFSGQEKSFWWDYHFCSVYHAHFLLWSVLALRDYGSMPGAERASTGSSTGLERICGEAGGAYIFAGRSTYLAEAGPALCALWLSDKGVVFKGGLGPWQGKFGKKYSFADTVFQNHFGLVSQKNTQFWAIRRLVRRLVKNHAEDRDARLYPVFADIRVNPDRGIFEIVFEAEFPMVAYLNIPIFEEHVGNTEISLSVDGRLLESILSGKSRNQYGWIGVTRSEVAYGRRWKVEIR